MKPLLKGKLFRLAAVDAEEISKFLAGANRDSELMRLLDSVPSVPHSSKKTKEWFEKHLDEMGDTLYWFTIRTLEGNCLLGDISLEVVNWQARDAFVGLGISPREIWGKGYGTEAMQLALEYAFLELNLRRVTLDVFEYNPRAIRSYEKAGFRHEGRQRGALFKEGKRWDLIHMGILRDEWMEKNGFNTGNE
jgi:RimJ/RimL family protein N-acetyltransferase